MPSCQACPLSLLPLLSFFLSRGVADLSLICKLQNSSLDSIKLCAYACVSMPKITLVIMSQRGKRKLSSERGTIGRYTVLIPKVLLGYWESAINLHPALLPFPYSSWLSAHPPPTALIGVIVAPPQSNDRERESCVTLPHQTINLAYWEAHPKPCDPHATQTDSTLYFFKWVHLGLCVSRQYFCGTD